MTDKFFITPDLGNVGRVQDRLREEEARFKVGEEISGHLLAAGAQAFSALCLAGPQEPVRMDLRQVRAELFLRFFFSAPDGARPVGLDRELFCPPAKGVSLDIKNGQAVWVVSWEVPAWT